MTLYAKDMEKKYKNKLPLEEQAYFREIKNIPSDL